MRLMSDALLPDRVSSPQTSANFASSSLTVIPAQAGIQIAALVSRLRGNDVTQKLRFDKALACHV